MEDNAALRELIALTLRQRGYEVIEAKDGAQALERHDDAVDVLLTDVVMPGMSGYQAKRRLGKINETCHIPVIFVTSKDSEADRSWGMRQGAVEYLVKPVADNELVAKIHSVMAA